MTSPAGGSVSWPLPTRGGVPDGGCLAKGHLGKFAFIIHPINARRDVARKGGIYRVAQYLPEQTVEWLIKHKEPIVASHITGSRVGDGGRGGGVVHRLPADAPAAAGTAAGVRLPAADPVRPIGQVAGGEDHRAGRVHVGGRRRRADGGEEPQHRRHHRELLHSGDRRGRGAGRRPAHGDRYRASPKSPWSGRAAASGAPAPICSPRAPPKWR